MTQIYRCWRCDQLYLKPVNAGLLRCPVSVEVHGEVYCQPHWDPVSDRDILIAIFERIIKMPDLTELQTTITSLTQLITDFRPVMQTSMDLSQVVIGKLEELARQIAALSPTQDAIDALKASAAAALAEIQSDKDKLVSVNQAYTDELNKLTPPPATPPAPVPAVPSQP